MAAIIGGSISTIVCPIVSPPLPKLFNFDIHQERKKNFDGISFDRW
jgi:hypothetical protein